MDGRILLDLIADYVATKDNAERYSEVFNEGEAEAQLSKIAAAFEAELASAKETARQP